MQVTPLSGAEIVARGLTGTWAHLGISNGADWVNGQKRNRRERLILTYVGETIPTPDDRNA